MSRIIKIISGFFFSVGVIFNISAAPLAPGGSQFPALGEAGPVGGTVVFSTNVSFSSATLSGTLFSEVISGDMSSPYSGLTFAYRVILSQGSPNEASQLSISRFDSVATDASFEPGPNIAPSFISRSLESPGIGDVVRFHFGFGTPALDPGLQSDLLVIQTPSVSYQFSTASVIDGVAVPNILTVAPFAVPEPAALVLGALGLGLLVFRRRN